MHDMESLVGGELLMGSTDFYADEGPTTTRQVGPFRIDRHPVTNRQFAEFVVATGYVTVAERRVLLPGGDAPEAPGSLVFTPTSAPVPLDDWRQWWRWVPGACWRAPQGPGSSAEDLDDHPVVQVAHEDARAYAQWVGLELATEAEWEYAARGGLVGATYAWGEELHPDGQLMANTWQGHFPYQNTGALGWVGTSPVGTFPANGYGLHDMTGNVWEWTTDRYTPRHATVSPCGCSPSGGRGGDDGGDGVVRVLKGGSHLCAPEYCLRYRPAARSGQEQGSATTHIGFRCVDRRS